MPPPGGRKQGWLKFLKNARQSKPEGFHLSVPKSERSLTEILLSIKRL
jgi:hypothetical protein